MIAKRCYNLQYYCCPPTAAQISSTVPRGFSMSFQMRKFSTSFLTHSVQKSKGAAPVDSIVFLHGILGRRSNFRTAAVKWTKSYPNYSALLVDHRGHGENTSHSSSTHTQNNITRQEDDNSSNTVQSCAFDLMNLFTKSDLLVEKVTPPTILCGHSFGGKVSLMYLKLCIEANLPLPKHTWILDSLPGSCYMYRIGYKGNL